MTEGSDNSRPKREAERETSVETLASRALSILAQRNSGAMPQVSDKLMNQLHAATMSQDPADMSEALTAMRKAGVSDTVIVDVYIPCVARSLGADWASDDIGFASTSIGAARLQAMLREIAPPDPVVGPRGGGVAVVVLGVEQHTLGAMTLAAQLRWMGLSVRLVLGLGVDDSVARLEDGGPDAVFISAANARTVDSLRKFIESVKRRNKELPVVIGGPILELVDDISEEIGADFSSMDTHAAVKRCGLTAATAPATRGAP